MAGLAPQINIPQLPHLKAIVISAAWHPEICDALVAGAVRGFKAAGIGNPTTRTVAGSFELPLAAQLAFDEGFDVAVIVGLVLIT
jgi:6,7-dimethyl-8-ribityllumazine synthase